MPFLKPHLATYEQKFDDWRAYKQKVPVYGAILLNAAADKVRCRQCFWSNVVATVNFFFCFGGGGGGGGFRILFPGY